MKHRYLLLIISILAIGVVACKKDISKYPTVVKEQQTETAIGVVAGKKDSSSSKYPMFGKWQQTKLRLYGFDPSGALLYDTTYLHPFTNSDYLQFNNNDTVMIGTDHYYYPNQAGQPKVPQLIPATAPGLRYTTVDGKLFILNTEFTHLNPGGTSIADTIFTLNSNTLVFRSVACPPTGEFKLIQDAYYSK
jgi:hypothetical protein